MSTGQENLEAIYAGIKAVSQDSVTLANIEKKYGLLKALEAGQPSPAFAYESIDGSQISLADLRGKYVYIDVWATWCGPCKREIPSLKQLETDYHGQNIEFVSISVDSEKDYEKWKTFVAEQQLSGVQLYADKSWQSDFIQSYVINSIPRFLLIDPEGNIVSPDADRPSNPKIREQFDQLLAGQSS